MKSAILLSVLALQGCAYWNTVTSRQGTPDPRTPLPSTGQFFLTKQEIPQYTCAVDHILSCQKGPTSEFACYCKRR
jgi:hypothetical protein